MWVGKPQGPTHCRLQDSTSKWLLHSGHGDPLPSGSCPQQPGDRQQVARGGGGLEGAGVRHPAHAAPGHHSPRPESLGG